MFKRKPNCIGQVIVTTAGTSVRATSTLSNPAADLPTPWIFIQAAEDNTGVVYVGTAAVTDTNYIVALGPGEGMELTPTQIKGTEGEYFLNDFYLDAETSGNSVQITYDVSRG